MNTKVKAGIAAAILAALVALIILDQKTATKPAPAETETQDAVAVDFGGPILKTEQDSVSVVEGAPLNQDDEYRKLYPGKKVAPKPPIKQEQRPNQISPKPFHGPIQPTIPLVKEYVIQEGDNYESIAKHVYGKRSLWPLIAKANPQMPALRLRPGKKIVIPPQSNQATATTPAPSIEITGDKRFYTVSSGDTLGGISVKIYKTLRHWRTILNANRNAIDDPNWLIVGTKLTLPNVPKAQPSSNTAAAAGTGTVATSAPSDGRKHEVRPNESLWKIAEKYRRDRGIMEMIDAIVRANPGKVVDASTMLQVGWDLIIPR